MFVYLKNVLIFVGGLVYGFVFVLLVPLLILADILMAAPYELGLFKRKSPSEALIKGLSDAGFNVKSVERKEINLSK